MNPNFVDAMTSTDFHSYLPRGIGRGARSLSWPDRVRIVVVVLLLGLTVGWFNLFPRYQRSGEDLQGNGRFERDLEGWSIHGPPGAVSVSDGSARLELLDPSETVRLDQILAPEPDQRILGITLEASSEGVEPRGPSWPAASVVLVGRNAAGKSIWNSRLEAAVLSGDTPWKRYAGRLFLPKRATDALVAAEMSRATGVLRIRDVRVFPMSEAASFRTGVYALLAAWAMAGLFVVPAVYRGLGSTSARALTGAAVLAILAGVLVPYPWKRDVFRPLQDGLRAAHSQLPPLPAEIDRLVGPAIAGIDTLAHAVFFFAAALIVRLVRRHDPASVQFGLLLLFAAVTEAFQYFTLSRSPGLRDWLFDAGGIALAFVVAWCLGAGRKPRRV